MVVLFKHSHKESEQPAQNVQAIGTLTIKGDAVFWHEGSKFSILTLDENTKESKRQTFGDYSNIYFTDIDNERVKSYYQNVRLFIDLQSNMKPYVECSFYDSGITDKCSLHISSYDDLNGAGWNHGKFGSGNTSRIH